MKALTIKEPFVSLIKEQKKKIETRSFKTNYRGELYIHAGKAKIGKEIRKRENLMKLIKDMPLNYGKIICKCRLVDCVYMTEEYINYIKCHFPQEYFCGQYEVGRYAWILEEIIPLETPKEIKGQLGIWNIEK